MRKILVMPDSFKGTMSSMEACEIIKSAIGAVDQTIEVRNIPIADGGEGSVECFLAAIGGEKVNKVVTGPDNEPIDSFYGLIENGNTAVIEMASCAGLPLTKLKNPEKTTTYGVGELINLAIAKGVRKIILALGGSATNDCGTGMLAALGVKFFDGKGKEFLPTGGTLSQIKDIDINNLKERLKGVTFTAMCDIDNPLTGERGASYIFSPQKGADKDMVLRLEKNVEDFSSLCKKRNLCKEINFEGAGAAGGMGFAAKYFLGSDIIMGIEAVLDAVKFDDILTDTDLIISGEGRLDSQTLRGKVVAGIAKRAKEKNVPLIAVVGDVGDNFQGIYDRGVTAVFSINRVALPYQEIKLRAKKDLFDTVFDIMKLIKANI